MRLHLYLLSTFLAFAFLHTVSTKAFSSNAALLRDDFVVTLVATEACPVVCNGTIALTATGVAPYTFSWSNGATVQNPTNLCPGIYFVTVTDATGDVETSGISVPAHIAIDIDAVLADASCASPCSGSITTTVGGGGGLPYSFLWSDANTAQNRTNLCAGTYTLTVTSGDGCTASATYTIGGGMSTPCLVSGADSIPTGGSIQLCAVAGMSYAWSTGSTAQCIDATTAGTYTVTISDGSGCSASCAKTVFAASTGGGGGGLVSCSVSSTLAGGSYTGGTSTNIFLGYGPTSASLNVDLTGSAGPYTYNWSSAFLSCSTCPNPVFTPSADGNYTIEVIVTTPAGNTTCDIEFCVVNVIDSTSSGNGNGNGNGNNNHKVLVCHVPPGNPSNAHTVSVSVNAVPPHLSNHGGDHLGPCGSCQSPTSMYAMLISGLISIEADHAVHVHPNPFSGQTLIEFSVIADEANLVLEIYNTAGAKVAELFNGEAHADHHYHVDFNGTHLPDGLYFYRLVTSTEAYSGTLVRMR